MPPSSPTPKSRPDTHLPHRGRGGRTVGGRAPHPVISSGKCSQTKSREDARPSAAGRTAVWPARLRVTWGRGVSGGATRKPRDESGQARAAPPPASRRGRGDSTVFPPRPWCPGFQFCSLESCPCFQGFCVSEGEDTEMGETTGREPRQVCPALCTLAGRSRQGSSLRSERGAEREFPLQENIRNVSPLPRWAWSWGAGEGALGTHCRHVLTFPHTGHRRRQPWAHGGSWWPGPAPSP